LSLGAEEASMAFTVTEIERPKDEAAPGKTCDSCGILLLSCNVGAPDASAADVENWTAVGLSPAED
jgi:hypothetical protein